MKKVKFNLIRTVDLDSWQEFELTDEQVKQLEKLDYDDYKLSYLCNLNKINYDNEMEDDTISVEIQGLTIEDIKERKFNFRAWFYNKMYIVRRIDYDLGSFYEKDGVRSEALVTLAENELTTESEYINKPIEELKIMQSTGTADKNGKEIYEGDIVKIGNLIKQVKFTCYGCRFQLTDKDGYFFDSIYKNRTDEIEVIGNIFENKDLLKN